MAPPRPAAIDPATSEKIRVLGLLLTLFVVFHHGFNLQFATGPVAEPLRWGEDLLHFGLRGLSVPFFFVCSAYFLCARPWSGAAWGGEVRKRVRSLLVPFLLWSAAWLLVMAGLQAIPALAPLFGREGVHLTDARQTLRLLVLEPIPHPLWYMRDLFVLTLLSPLVLACLRRRVGAALYFAAAAWLWCSVPSIAVREAQDLFFFGVGAWLALRGPLTARPPAWALALGALLYAVFTGLNIAYVRQHAVEQPVLFNLGILVGLPTLWWSIDGLRRTRAWAPLLAASRWALFIYLGHEPLQALLRKPVLRACGGDSATLAAVWLVGGSLVVVALAATGELLARAWPRLYGLLTGGRLPSRAPAAARPVAAPSSSPSPTLAT